MDLPEHRLPASTEVPALVRQVQAAGGFATVLHKGSQWGAALLLVHRHGAFVGAYEKLPALSGTSEWRLAAEGEQQVSEFVNRQLRFDTDLWVLELDIALPERFIPGFPASR